YTLACCRSAETSVRVTVTPLTRGSRISNRMVSAATSRMTSATRAVRWAFMATLYLDLVSQKLRDRVDAQGLSDLAERHLDAVDLGADHGDAQLRQLAVVLVLDLRHRDVELVTQ